MDNRRTDNRLTKRLLDLHALAGVVSGLFIFIISLSGIFALFEEELLTWEQPALRIALPEQPVALMPLLEDFAEELGRDGKLLEMDVHLISPATPFYEVSARVRPAGERSSERRSRRFHPASGAVLPPPVTGFVHWLVNFHGSLMLPRTYGRAIVAISGLFLTLSILSGVVIHRKILKELFTWRFNRSIRVKWQDSHKALSVWGLPFHLVIALTGIWLGVVALLLPINAMLAMKGDIGAVFDALAGPQVEASGVSAQALPVDELMPGMARLAGQPLHGIHIERWGDETATYRFQYHPRGPLTGMAIIDVRATDGEVLLRRDADRPGITFHVVSAITTLHFASFGGIAMKFIYALLGIALCVIVATGLMVWLEKRRFGGQGRAGDDYYRRLGQSFSGTCLGLLIASFALFYADKLLTLQDGRTFWIGTIFFTVWGAVLVYALVRTDEYALVRELFFFSGVMSLGIPVANALFSSHGSLLSDGFAFPYVAGADLVCLFVAGALLLVGRRLPLGRQVTAKRRLRGVRPAQTAGTGK